MTTIRRQLTATVGAAILLIVADASAAERVRILFDVPAGTGGYHGRQPVRFGVPFPQGALPVADGRRIVGADGQPQPAQFEVAATWTAAATDVRWLLIDCFAEIADGVAEPAYLEFGPDVARDPYPPLQIPPAPALTTVLTDGDGTAFNEVAATAETVADGPVRRCIKRTGAYTDAKGRSIAAFVTFVRTHPSGLVRIFHTLNWLTDDQTAIGSLRLRLPDLARRTYRAGVDRAVVAGADGALSLRQTDWDTVAGLVAGEQLGRQLDGWVAGGSDADAVFAAVRWPWQQYPLSVGGDRDGLVLGLLDPRTPMSLAAAAAAVPGVLHNVPAWNLRIFKDGLPGGDVIYNGPEALPHLTPRGIAKTWEIVVWPGDPRVPAPVKNILVQHPVFAYADPEFATRAELPSPAAPRDAEAFPEVEAALERAFDFYTRELPEEGDFGVWNHGDLQWTWTYNGTPIYRYWMNLGKGWSITPWALWLRSGDRRYLENAEANSRHCMDIDTCHIPGWARDQTDWRLRGGQYHYSAIHWGYGPEVFTYYVDSEYLPYCWYMSGYERARDLLLEHAEAVARFADREAYLEFFRQDIMGRAGRHLYVMVKNLAVLYEATWDERLRTFAETCLELTLMAQQDNGNFVHVKTNHYLDQPLNIAARVFGWERVGDALKRWHDMLGDPLRPGTEGGSIGPMSLWTAVNLYRHTGDRHYLTVAGQMMRTQAATIMDGDNEWRGLSFVPGHEAGPALRDWPIAMAELRRVPVAERSPAYLPMASLSSFIPASKAEQDEGWGTRHVAFTLADGDQPIDLLIRFAGRPEAVKLVVAGPDGNAVIDELVPLPKATVAYDGTPIRRQLAVAGKPGVYTIVLTTQGQPTTSVPVNIHSSSDKLVHYFPEGRRVVASGMARGGILWFEPQPGAQCTFGLMLGQYVGGRTIALDPTGRRIAVSTVSGTKPLALSANAVRYAAGVPIGVPCSFQAPAEIDGLYAFVAADNGKPHRWITIAGNRPYVSTTREAWFDPEQHAHADLATLLPE